MEAQWPHKTTIPRIVEINGKSVLWEHGQKWPLTATSHSYAPASSVNPEKRIKYSVIDFYHLCSTRRLQIFTFNMYIKLNRDCQIFVQAICTMVQAVQTARSSYITLHM